MIVKIILHADEKLVLKNINDGKLKSSCWQFKVKDFIVTLKFKLKI